MKLFFVYFMHITLQNYSYARRISKNMKKEFSITVFHQKSTLLNILTIIFELCAIFFLVQSLLNIGSANWNLPLALAMNCIAITLNMVQIRKKRESSQADEQDVLSLLFLNLFLLPFDESGGTKSYHHLYKGPYSLQAAKSAASTPCVPKLPHA